MATARYGKKEHGRDKILNRIKSMKKYYINLESIFRNQDTTTIIKNWSTDGATLVGKAVQP